MLARSKVVGLLLEAWNDLDRVVDGLTPEEAVRQYDGGSSFAWTYAHVANIMEGWVNLRFQGLPPHPLIGRPDLRAGGTGAAPAGWGEVRAGVSEVREASRAYLADLSDGDLDLVIPYDGSIAALRPTGLRLRYAVLRNVAHHYYHIGEIATKRDRLGHHPGGYPGTLSEAI
jgi:hypothetical protein